MGSSEERMLKAVGTADGAVGIADTVALSWEGPECGEWDAQRNTGIGDCIIQDSNFNFNLE